MVSLVYCIVTPLLYDYAHGFRYLCTGIPTDLGQAKIIKVTHRYRSRWSADQLMPTLIHHQPMRTNVQEWEKKEKNDWTQVTSRVCMPLASGSMWTKMQSYWEGPLLHDNAVWICSQCIPPILQILCGAKKVAIADEYMIVPMEFWWMSEVELQLDSLWSWLYKISEEDYKNLVAEFPLVEHVQFVFILWVKFSDVIVVGRVVTCRQFWQGQHGPFF